MADDFMGSVAQEDIQFLTEINRVVIPGENFMKLAVFCEEDRYIEDPAALINANAGGTIKYAIVTSDNYAQVTNGRLRTWLGDFFAEQNTYPAYVITFTADLVADTDWDTSKENLLLEAFNLFKASAAFKTILVGSTVVTNPTLPAAAVSLAELVSTDTLLSLPVLLPVTDPENILTDPIYAALDAAEQDAFLVGYTDIDRNTALYQLSISLSVLNASGTPVGSSFDFVSANGLSASGTDGAPLSVTTQTQLKSLSVSYWKPVGDGTGNVCLFGAKSIRGVTIPAEWIVRYTNYRCKMQVAGFVTRMNTFRNNNTYNGILSIMSRIVDLFTTEGSGRLSNFKVTAPSFADLPESGSTILVPNAWTAVYVDNTRKVQVSGSLTIVEG